MKRKIAVILMTAALLGLAACKQETPESAMKETTEAVLETTETVLETTALPEETAGSGWLEVL